MKKRLKNFEKFKTAEERANAFDLHCEETKCKNKCDDALSCRECQFAWLDLEAGEEKPLPCPFCGEECTATVMQNEWRVSCIVSGCYRSSFFGTEADAIAAHNRVAKAVISNNKGE